MKNMLNLRKLILRTVLTTNSWANFQTFLFQAQKIKGI